MIGVRNSSTARDNTPISQLPRKLRLVRVLLSSSHKPAPGRVLGSGLIRWVQAIVSEAMRPKPPPVIPARLGAIPGQATTGATRHERTQAMGIAVQVGHRCRSYVTLSQALAQETASDRKLVRLRRSGTQDQHYRASLGPNLELLAGRQGQLRRRPSGWPPD